MVRKIARRLREFLLSRRPSGDKRLQFYEAGFHGDTYLLELVDLIMDKCNIFIETGTNVGSTLAYVARRFPHVRCFSCEPDQMAYNYARENTRNLDNISLFNETSQRFMRQVLNKEDVLNDEVLFWIDAHGYGFQWPLREEIKIITTHWEKAFVLIDDFLVPGLDCFGYDEYDGQVCSFDYIKGSLNRRHEYHLYYPTYANRTSKHHPLRGWGLIEFGHTTELELPESLKRRTRETSVCVSKIQHSGSQEVGVVSD